MERERRDDADDLAEVTIVTKANGHTQEDRFQQRHDEDRVHFAGRVRVVLQLRPQGTLTGIDAYDALIDALPSLLAGADPQIVLPSLDGLAEILQEAVDPADETRVRRIRAFRALVNDLRPRRDAP
jgi:hypothetical protein